MGTGKINSSCRKPNVKVHPKGSVRHGPTKKVEGKKTNQIKLLVHGTMYFHYYYFK